MAARNPTRVTNGHRAAVCGLVIAGLTFGESCKIVGIPYMALRDALPKGWHEGKNGPRRWRGDELEELEHAYVGTKERVDTIAARHNITRSWVLQLAKRHGWPVRQAGRPKVARSLSVMSPEKRRLYAKLRRVLPYEQALAGALA